MRLNTRVSGVQGAIAGLRRFGLMTTRALNQGTKDAAEVAFRQSQVYVPVEFGALKASGTIKTTSKKDGTDDHTIEYGGASAPYALPVHEIPTAYHAPPTSWKYLEKAIRETKAQQSWALRRRMQTATTGWLK